MNPYICVTYAHEDRQQSDLFCRGLTRYGFRFDCIHDLGDPERREETLCHCALLIALTSDAAVWAETVASDIRHALERGVEVLCVSLEENELDHRFCTGTVGGATLIPFPSEDTLDRHPLSLFVHRLYVRHLARHRECFAEARCDDNVYGNLIRCAYYAHGGDSDACFELGRAYELGIGVPVLEKEAALWLKRAAEQDVCDALIRMGQLYVGGIGTERDPEAGFRAFRRAKELGDIRGVYHCGLCYLEGWGVMRDPVHAIECLKNAACMQYAPAMYRLAVLHRDGIGTERDVYTALKYLYAVCGQGYTQDDERIVPPITVYGRRPSDRYVCITMRHLRHKRVAAGNTVIRESAARRHSKISAQRCFGRNTVSYRELPEDRWDSSLTDLFTAAYDASAEEEAPAEGYNIYEQDWTRADAAMAAFELGRILEGGSETEGLRPSPTRALVWYRYAARLGHIEALYTLGDAYRRGFGTPADIDRAVELFRLAAEGGSERGLFAYAVCCERGIGMAADQRAAFRFYEQAAAGGYAPAQNNLGGCYEYGIGTPRNTVAAVEWYAAAANAGQPDGQCRLGICYELGLGVTTDKEKAIRLYELAAEQGHAYALYRRALCYDRETVRDGGFEGETELLLTEILPEVKEIHAREPEENRGGSGTASVQIPPVKGSASAIDHTRAAAMYKQAADGGVPEAAYARYLSHRLERGVVRDEHEEIRYLSRAAEGGCLQAAYELGLCYMEGCGLPKDQMAAVACFTHAVNMWRACVEDSRLMAYLTEPESLPADALSPRRAAGGALYMLGYCALYGMGEGRDNRTAEPDCVPAPDCVAKALPFFREAASIDHVGALVMLGDLYAYGILTSDTASAEDEALHFYLDAERAGLYLAEAGEATRGISLRDPTDTGIDAQMTLAERALRVADGESDPGSAEMARVNAWRSYSDCAARGSADALVAMAECLHRGYGTVPNITASVRLLRRAQTLDGGRIAAALWLGDALRGRWNGPASPDEADAVYLRGLQSACMESECGPYTLGLRRNARKQADIRARAEILYRIATLRAVHFSGTVNGRESFRYLAEAVLMGHTAALDDLARIFAYESKRPRGASKRANRDSRKGWGLGSKTRLRRRMQENSDLHRNSRAVRIHREWLCDYYTALCPEPLPFAYAMNPTATLSEAPEYATAPVTDLMRANALQYLGECFFEGYGLPEDTAAAAACYRGVLTYAPKGVPTPPPAVVEATYSLGWCMLYGVGTAVNCPEAMRLLNSVSRNHAGACFTLGVCYEEGRGVVVADDHEAVKFYRKAQKMGHPRAAERIEELERRLRNHAEE